LAPWTTILSSLLFSLWLLLQSCQKWIFFLPIIWDELDDFDGEDQELAGDFFFDVESNEGKPV
jgi:hypothetical protein